MKTTIFKLLSFLGIILTFPVAAGQDPSGIACLAPSLDQLIAIHDGHKEATRSRQLLLAIKTGVKYPDIPDVTQLRLPLKPPELKHPVSELSAGLTDAILEEARKLSSFEDFKPLSDCRPRVLTNRQMSSIIERAESSGKRASNGLSGAEAKTAFRRAFLRSYIEEAYDFTPELRPMESLADPKWTIETDEPALKAAFAYTERTWSRLVRRTVPEQGGSLLATPYPVIVPAGRFQEPYYWDTYFGVKGLLVTGRTELAMMQAENFLYFVQKYGRVPNGGRDYYLSRSQPPFLSSLIREIYVASNSRSKVWLRDRAYPLLKKDYEDFWMNPSTRFDPSTGLNHHWDEVNLPRPERHSFDNELSLGKTYRDTRAAAESGLDFTEALGREATKTAGVLLNSILFKTETDLSWIARQIGRSKDAELFAARATARRHAIDKYLWNEEQGRYENYDLSNARRIPILTADTFAPLFVKAANPKQAEKVRANLAILEKSGGIMASELTSSPHQWDGNNGWAPQQMIAMQGLKEYGFETEARRIAQKWTSMIAKDFEQNGAMYERMDVATLKKPMVDETKYPPQEGFLWTNSSYVWALHEILGVKLLLTK